MLQAHKYSIDLFEFVFLSPVNWSERTNYSLLTITLYPYISLHSLFAHAVYFERMATWSRHIGRTNNIEAVFIFLTSLVAALVGRTISNNLGRAPKCHIIRLDTQVKALRVTKRSLNRKYVRVVFRTNHQVGDRN